MKQRLPQIHVADRRQTPATPSSILKAVPFLLIVALLCVSAEAKKKSQLDPRDPYATAENEKAPAVNPADLAYRTILFEDFSVPAEWEADARKLVNATEDQAVRRLFDTHAFTSVARRQGPLPEDPSLVVKCTLVNYRVVSRTARVFVGIMAGRSYLSYRVQVYDGKSNTLQFQREITTENSVFSGTFSNTDNELSTFLGNVLGDYLALRARKDKGVDVLPLENLSQTAPSK